MFNMLLVILLMFKITSGQNIRCNDKYCLYEVKHNYERISIHQAKSMCSQNGTNGWLLEVYDDKVDSLVWSLINQNKLSYKNFLMGTKKFSKEWTWINGKTANVEIDNQVFNNAVAYVSKSNDKQIFEYHAGYPTSTVPYALCLSKNSPNCTREHKWSHNGNCYYPIWGTYTWYEAYYKCIEVGGSLAVFDELDLKDVNQTWVQFLWNANYWIGLSKSLLMWDKADIFINFTRLTGNQQASSDECIVLSSGDNSFSWLSLPCTGPYNIICMRDKSPAVATQLPPKAQTNRPSATERTTSTTIFQPWTNFYNDKSSRHDSHLESTNKSPKISFEQHLGIGVGVTLFVLILLLAVVLGVVCTRKNKFRTSQQSSIKQKHKKQQQQQQPSNDINLNDNTNNSNKHIDEIVYSTVININKPKPTATTTTNNENNDTSEPNLIEYADLQFVQNINNDNNTNNIYKNANTNIKDNNQIINNENIYYNG